MPWCLGDETHHRGAAAAHHLQRVPAGHSGQGGHGQVRALTTADGILHRHAAGLPSSVTTSDEIVWYYTATKIPFMYFFSGNYSASVPILHSCVGGRLKYSQDRSAYISCRRIGRSIVGIYKSLTDTWIWKFGLCPRAIPIQRIFISNFCIWFFAA
jgi:hypothetical protein